MNVVVHTETDRVDSMVASYLLAKAGQRGIETYEWLVSIMRRTDGASSVALVAESVSGVLTSVSGSAVLHSLQGDLEAGAEVILAAREHAGSIRLRGLALPGDRMTKNLFEEARLPAQVLLH